MPTHTDHDAHRRRRSRAGALLTALTLLASMAVAGPAPAALATGGFTAGGSINQVYTYGHRPATIVHLLAPDGEVIGTGLADAQGAYLFKGIAEGDGYRVSAGDTVSQELTV